MKLIRMLPKFSRTTLAYAAGIITAFIGLLVLIGWAFDIEILKSPLPGAVSMKANTAAAFLLAGLALILLQRSRPIANALVRFCALVIALVGFLSLCEYLFAWNLGIDEILFREPGVLIATLHPGRMAPNTALNFALLGFAFFVLTIQRFRSSLLVEFPLIFSLSISVIGLTGYVTGLLDLTGLGPVAYTKMAVHTAGAFIILCIGMLFTAYGQQRSPVTIEQKLFAGLTVAAAVIIFITFLSVSSIQSLRQASQKVMDAENQQHQLENVLQLVLEVQSGQRGFLIAGEDKYLIPPQKAILELPTLINNLHLQIADNPHLQQNFESLVQLVEARIAFFDQVVLIRKTKGEAEAISFFATGKGKIITDSIRALVSQMIADEDLVLQTHQKVEEDRASRTQLIIFVSFALQVLLLAFIFVVVNRDVIGRKKAEEKLHKLNEELEDRVKERTAELAKREDQYKFLSNQFEAILDHIPGLIFYKDTKNNFVRVNKYVADAHHTTKEELENKSCFELYPKKDAQAYFEDDLKVISSGQPKLYFEEPWETENGLRWVSTSKVPFVDIEGKIIGILGISFDITEHKQAEEEIKKANRIYAVLSNINQAIVRVKDKQKLFDEVCRIAVEIGKFRMAWIGMVDPQTNKVIPVASDGFTGDYIKTINIDLNDEELGQGPTGRAIKSGVHYFTNDIDNNPEMIPWRENALKLGYKSSAAFPIKVFGKTVGAFMLYSDEKFFFDEAEIKLLDELAMDISFAIEFNETETKRKLAEEKHRESTERFNRLVSELNDIIWTASIDGSQLFDVNDSFEKFYGVTVEEFKANPKLWIEMVHPDDRKTAEESGKLLYKNGKAEAEYRIIRPDGTIRWLSDRKSIIYDDQGKPIQMGGIGKDITERKIVEIALRQSEEQFNLASKATLDVIWDWDLKTNKIWRSENFDNIYGQIEDEIEGSSKEAESRVHPDDRERVMKKINEFLSSENELWEDEYRFKRKDGNYAWVLDRGLQQRDNKGNPVRMIGSMWDQTERRVQAELLKSSEEKYRSLVDNALVGVYETNLDGEISYANEALVNILGFKSLEELKKTKIQERYANVSDREKFINTLKEKGYLVNYELDFITLDKQIIHAILSAKLQNDRITGMFLDATEKKTTEKELLENEKRLRSIINSTPLGSHVYEIIDGDLILTDANSSANIILGVDHRKLKNKNIKDIFPLIGFSGISDEFKNVALTGKSFTKDFIISGEGIFTGIFEFFAFQIKKNSMALFFRDVSEQKKLELRIQKSEERFKLASQATHDSIWDWDLKTNKVWWSENMNKIFDLDIGNTETDIKKWYELIHPEDLHRVEVGIKEAINGGKEYWSDEYRLLMGDGNYAYALDRGYIIRDKYRKPIRMVGSILDYTEKVRHEQDLIAAKEKAEEANRLKSGFISAMSHEIRTPLNIILGYNDLIKDMYSDPANEEIQAYFNSITNNGSRLIDTITKILDISRIEAGEFPISIQPISLKEILDSTYNSMKILAEKKKLRLVFNPPAENISVLADTYCLENSLINLVNNAIKYSEKGTVEISAIKENDFVLCQIKDEGIGMSESYQKHLFQTFSQEKVGISRPYEGVGLGLALTKKYCERMQAGLEIQSKEGLGTTVTIKLPLAK